MITFYTNCINEQLPLIYGNCTEDVIINVYNQDFILQKSLDVVEGDFIITLDDVIEDNFAFVVSTTINDLESGFLKILPICCNNYEHSPTC